MLNDDYKEMLSILSEEKVKYLVIGAFALGTYGYPRATGDIDIWVEASIDNSNKVFKSLARFGAPTDNIEAKDFEKKGIIFQIGIAPRRIDITTVIDGVDFEQAYPKRKIVNIEGINIPIISCEDLILNKESTGREKDLLDVKMLKQKNKL
ncbi:MAG TPA: nucleotidyltransferase [Clostridiales bacterium]|nr:nucleotidyltransferase [Clostridiales bacterium]